MSDLKIKDFDLINREELIESLIKCKELGRKSCEAVAKIIKELPGYKPVESIPQSYIDQIRWERDIAIEQLHEIGCEFGIKMDEIKKKLEAVPVVNGKWRHIGGDEWGCTACGHVITTEGSWEKPDENFCPNCGCDMRKKV